MSEPATKQDLEQLREASKQDLADTAAKLRAELEAKLASKQDLEQLREASKQDLDNAVTQLRTELEAKLASKQDLEQLREVTKNTENAVANLPTRREVQHELDARFDGLRLEMAQIASHVGHVMDEHLRARVNVVAERYQDLPAQVTTLRHDLDDHRSDERLHTPPSRPRRTATTRRRRTSTKRRAR